MKNTSIAADFSYFPEASAPRIPAAQAPVHAAVMHSTVVDVPVHLPPRSRIALSPAAVAAPSLQRPIAAAQLEHHPAGASLKVRCTPRPGEGAAVLQELQQATLLLDRAGSTPVELSEQSLVQKVPVRCLHTEIDGHKMELVLSEKAIGRGAFATVYAGSNRADPNQHFAVKVSTHKDFSVADARNEWAMGAACTSRAAPLAVLADASSPIMLMRPMHARLHDITRSLGEQKPHPALRTAVGVLALLGASGQLEEMHAEHKVHADVQPGNILLEITAETVCSHLSDFGMSVAQRSPQAEASAGGALQYRAPELLEETCTRVTSENDVWALGMVGLELMTGDHLFGLRTHGAQSVQEFHLGLAGMYISGLPNYADWSRTGSCADGDAAADFAAIFAAVPNAAVEKLLRAALAYAPEERPTAAALHAALAQLYKDLPQAERSAAENYLRGQNTIGVQMDKEWRKVARVISSGSLAALDSPSSTCSHSTVQPMSPRSPALSDLSPRALSTASDGASSATSVTDRAADHAAALRRTDVA